MCVIMLASKTRPTEEMIDKAYDQNPHMAGIAWRETAVRGDRRVRVAKWKKGLKLEAIKELCFHAPLPYVVHFRVASIGGVRESLTHPFPVSEDVDLALEGETSGNLLFHNGHYEPWADKALDLAINTGRTLPVGEYSDTRALAWIVNIIGPGFMEILKGQKGVLFGPHVLDVFTGGSGWEKINDVWCSNDYFWTGKKVRAGYTQKLCSVGKCQNNAMSYSSLCWEHDKKQKEQQASSTANDAEDGGGSKATETKVDVSRVGGNTNKLPLERTLTLSEAEEIYTCKGMSQRKIKKFRRYYSDLNKGGNKAKRATTQLWKLSSEVVENLSSGSAH